MKKTTGEGPIKKTTRLRAVCTSPAEPDEPLWSKVLWVLVFVACLVFIGAVIARAEDRLTIPRVIGEPGTTVTVPITLTTGRDVGAVRASFHYDHDASGITFGGATLGQHLPPSWDFAVYSNLPEYPGVVVMRAIGSGIDFVQGTDLEVFRATFTLGACGTGTVLTMPPDRELQHLATVQLNSVVADCSNYSCCCFPTLELVGGSVAADCPTDVTGGGAWARVKAIYK